MDIVTYALLSKKIDEKTAVIDAGMTTALSYKDGVENNSITDTVWESLVSESVDIFAVVDGVMIKAEYIVTNDAVEIYDGIHNLICSISEGDNSYVVTWGQYYSDVDISVAESGVVGGKSNWLIGEGNSAVKQIGATSAGGSNAMASGRSTQAGGLAAHAEGVNTSASAEYSHAEGNGSQVTSTGMGGHAEGYQGLTVGQYAHSEGYSTEARGHYSHAEGNDGLATSEGSHVEGYKTISYGNYSHAEGDQTIASGDYSNSRGRSTVSRGMASNVFGRFNVDIDSEVEHNEYGTYVEVVGNGLSNASRSNARTLDWNGNEYLKGDVYVDCDANSANGFKVATDLQLIPYINDTFEGTRAQSITMNFPSGTYRITASSVTSNDTDSNICLINFLNGQNDVGHVNLNRGVSIDTTITLQTSASSVMLYASDNYTNSANDTFSFNNLKIERYDTLYNILNSKVGKTDYASSSEVGVVKVNGNGLQMSNGTIIIDPATATNIKDGTHSYRPIVPSKQDASAFYGLAKAAGDTSQSQSANAVGTYTTEAKSAIRTMLGAVGDTDYATSTEAGIVIGGDGSYGVNVNAQHRLTIVMASSAVTKAGNSTFLPIVAYNQHEAAFYGLAKAAGDSTQSASSNAVGSYTDAAKVAIQKMLGIYEAPWELIREDTFTNETEADCIITADSNGQAFELTDVVLMFETPKQDTISSKADGDGALVFYNGDSIVLSSYNGTWSQAANATANGIWTMIEKKGRLVFLTVRIKSGSTSSTALYQAYKEGFNGTTQHILDDENFKITKINIPKVTGTGHYKLYGKRKWR